MLIDELQRVFGHQFFDATDVWAQAHESPALMAAIDAEVPRARYARGTFNVRAIRMALRRHAKTISKHRHQDHWVFRVK